MEHKNSHCADSILTTWKNFRVDCRRRCLRRQPWRRPTTKESNNDEETGDVKEPNEEEEEVNNGAETDEAEKLDTSGENSSDSGSLIKISNWARLLETKPIAQQKSIA